MSSSTVHDCRNGRFLVVFAQHTAIFTVDYATLLAPLPYPEPDQLVIVWSRIQKGVPNFEGIPLMRV
jgi:hypothetical protein